MVHKTLMLWTTPRSVSTAFERSIRTLSKTKVFTEIYSLPYYWGPERRSERHKKVPIDPQKTYENTRKTLLQDYHGIDLVFSKNMAYVVDTDPEFVLREMKGFKHSFLIRDPVKAIPSFYKLSTNSAETGWDYFDPEEAGFRQLYELYNVISEHVDPNPVLIDADDLLSDPDLVMKKYCEAVEIPYEAHMTSWEAGMIEDWKTWPKAWFSTLFESTGFIKHDSTKQKKKPDTDSLPQEAKKAIEEARPYYEYLYAKRMKINHA